MSDQASRTSSFNVPQLQFSEYPQRKPTMSLMKRAKVLAQLRNQTIRIDGLASNFIAWPFAINPALDRVRYEVNEWLDRYAKARI